nr:Nia-Pro [Caladenia virus A]
GDPTKIVQSVEVHMAILKNSGLKLMCLCSGDLVLAPNHFATKLDGKYGDVEMITRWGTFILKQPILVKHFEGTDLVAFRLPSDFPTIRKLKAFRVPKQGESVVLVFLERTKRGIETKCSVETTIRRGSDQLWRYNLETKPGQCGGLVLALTDGHIVGTHTGVSHGFFGTCAVFSPINNEIIAFVKEQNIQEIVKPWCFNPEILPWQHVSRIEPTGTLPYLDSIMSFLYQ